MQKTLFIFLACLLCVGKANAQKEANIWYFGDGLVWNFPEAKPKVSPQIKINTSYVRPSFTMSDSVGKLQFYTDGISVWNAKHEAITQNLNGERMIIATPYPKKKGFYYLFHIGILPADKRRSFVHGEGSAEPEPAKTDVFKLYYSLLDIQNNKMVEENVLINNDVLFDICIARHAEEGNYWLITHLDKSNQFFAYPITAKGFEKEEGKASTIGKRYEINGHTITGAYTMKTNILGTKILVAVRTLDQVFEVYDFNNKSGSVDEVCYTSTPKQYKIGLPEGYEFSPNGRFVYTLICSSVSFQVLQYDLQRMQKRDGVNYITEPVKGGFFMDLSNQKEALYQPRYGMQLAYDGNIYMYGFVPVAILNTNQLLDNGRLKTRMFEVPKQPYKSCRLPKITHLLPLSLAYEGETVTPIEVGKPFVREILFDSNQSILKTQYENSLQDIVAYLLKNPKTTIEIAGHTDNEGEETKNQKLSQDRAQALADFLIKNKVGKERIKAIGYGSAKPIADNSSPAGKAKNRRIEFLVR
jgi:outer membrane protein OmpA-like peptidoglycan-associated protein